MTKRNITFGTIKKGWTEHYPDNGQTVAYIEWEGGSSTCGNPNGQHMQALLERAKREGKLVASRLDTARETLREAIRIEQEGR
jgi:hypothetical protein